MIDLHTKTFWKASIALGIAAFITFSNIYFTQPLLPLFSDEFAVSPVVSSLSISLPLFTFGICFIVYSFFLDAYKRKIVIGWSIFIGGIMTALTAFVPSFEYLLILRVLQAMAFAGIPIVSMAYIGEEFSKKALTLAVGIYISANTVGGMGGRFISGIMTDMYDWRIAFVSISLISTILGLVFLKLLPPSNHFQSQAVNVAKTFRNYQMHLGNQKLLLAYLIGGIHFLIFVGIYNFITYVLSDDPFTVSTAVLGFLFITYLAGTVSSTLAGKVSQRLPQATCMTIGIGIMFIGIIITATMNFWFIIGGLLLVSFGFFFVHSCLTAWVSRVASDAKASASSIYLTSYYLGGSLASFYYGFFWNLAGWSGIVISSIVILIGTSLCTVQMRKFEKAVMHELQTNEMVVNK